jgi:mono/diheme cytochrome c family protein
MAEYADENHLLEACRKVRDSGYTRTDAFTPFPVHGIDEALGIKPTVLPWIVLCFGLSGLSLALVMQWWTNAYDYPYIISGKPYFSLPAFIPVTFELTILFSAFSTFLGMIALNGLPKFSNPVFTNPKFDRATDDRFFLWVDARDKYFNSDKVKSLLESTQPLDVDVVREDESSAEVPSFIYRTAAAVILISLIPAAVVLRMRAARSESPRLHVFFDMDFQPKKKAQQTTTLFADNRVMRQPVTGTIARGDLENSDPYYLGYVPENLTLLPTAATARLVRVQDATQEPALPDDAGLSEGADTPAQAASATAEPTEAADKPAERALEAAARGEATAQSQGGDGPGVTGQPPAPSTAAEEPEKNWIKEFPEGLVIDQKLMDLGRLKFNTSCSVCHGFAGDGDGLVSRRALQLAEGYWTPPTNLHESRVREQPVGKVFDTITHGRGKMGGYGPALTPKERWAIVLYIRALQRSRNASEGDLDERERAALVAAPAE